MERVSDLTDALTVPIPANEKDSCISGLRTQEAVQNLVEVLLLCGRYRITVFVGQIWLQFLKCLCQCGASLVSSIIGIAVKGHIAGDACDIRLQGAGTLRGDRIPEAQKSIVDALFNISVVRQDFAGDALAQRSILVFYLWYCVMGALKKQRDDLLILHGNPPFAFDLMRTL